MTGSQIFGIILGIYSFSLLIEYWIFQSRYDKLYTKYNNLKSQANLLMYWTKDQLNRLDYRNSNSKSDACQELANLIINQEEDFSLGIEWYKFFFPEKK